MCRLIRGTFRWPLICAAGLAPSLAIGQAPAVVPSEPEPQIRLLFVAPVPAKPRRGQPDQNRLIAVTLSDALRDKFVIVPYDPAQSLIKRALLEHEISAADVVSPDAPEALQRVAHAVGADFILHFTTSEHTDSLSTEVQLYKQATKSQWVTSFADTIVTRIASGKRRMKPAETADVVVDAVAHRLGIQTHLAPNLPAPTPAEKTGTPAHTVETPRSAPTDEIPSTPPVTPPKRQKRTPRGRQQSDPQIPATHTTAPGRPTAGPENPPPTSPPPANPPPAVAPQQVLPPAPRVDYTIEAARYRQSGDFASEIVALRHAVDERPQDVAVRALLAQAYLDRHLPDAAQAEVNRALTLKPDDATLLRLSGDVEMARGNAPGALKAYRDASARNPGDATAQVALGDALLAAGQYQESVSAYQEAARVQERSPLPHRRLARAFAARANVDTAQYAASVAEIEKARSLSPRSVLDGYQADYAVIMNLMESRFRNMLDTLQAAYQGQVTGKRTTSELKRATEELSGRAQAAADYLDRLPAATGQERTHLQYQQAAAFVAQAISLYQEFLAESDTLLQQEMESARLDGARALDAAARSLVGSHARPAGG